MSLIRQFVLELFEDVQLFVRWESEEEGDQLVRIESSEGRTIDVTYIHTQYILYCTYPHYIYTMCSYLQKVK